MFNTTAFRTSKAFLFFIALLGSALPYFAHQDNQEHDLAVRWFAIISFFGAAAYSVVKNREKKFFIDKQDLKNQDLLEIIGNQQEEIHAITRSHLPAITLTSFSTKLFNDKNNAMVATVSLLIVLTSNLVKYDNKQAASGIAIMLFALMHMATASCLQRHSLKLEKQYQDIQVTQQLLEAYQRQFDDARQEWIHQLELQERTALMNAQANELQALKAKYNLTQADCIALKERLTATDAHLRKKQQTLHQTREQVRSLSRKLFESDQEIEIHRKGIDNLGDALDDMLHRIQTTL